MARRKPAEPSAQPLDGPDADPPLELLRCPWTQWKDRFEEWLRDRQRWRETHTRPLPGLFARDRYAMHVIESLDREVVRTEQEAPKAEPEWVQRAKAAGRYGVRGQP